MEKEKIEKLYNLVISGYVLNKNFLLTQGFTEEEILYLQIKRYIHEVEENKYEIYSIDKFHKYGIKLLQDSKIKEANICFKICYKIKPNDRRITLQMLLAALKRNDYEEVLKIYQNLENNSYETHTLDNNLFLYLINIITELPEEYTERIRDFGYDDLVYPKTVTNKPENKIRVSIYKNKFAYACKVLNDHMQKRPEEYSVKYELLRALISKAIDSDKEFKNNLLELAKNEKYEEIIKILTERSNRKKLNRVETYVLLIAYAIKNMIETKTIPERTVDVTYDAYTAIMGNNFELALELNLDHHILTKTEKEDDIVYVLLTRINSLINETQSLEKNEELEKEIIMSEELAYYIASEKLSINEATKRFGIKPEQTIMIKLVYIRDYYIEGKTKLADTLLKEIEQNEILTPVIISFINKIKNYKETKIDLKTINHIRKRIKEDGSNDNRE